MYDVRCTMYNGQWTMDNGQWTMDNVQCTIEVDCHPKVKPKDLLFPHVILSVSEGSPDFERRGFFGALLLRMTGKTMYNVQWTIEV